jgi:hypothetical protein
MSQTELASPVATGHPSTITVRKRFPNTKVAKEYYLIRVLFFIPTLCVIIMAVALVMAASAGITDSTKQLAAVLRQNAVKESVRNILQYLENALHANEVSYSKWSEGKLNLTFNVITRHLPEAQENARVIKDHLYHFITDSNSEGSGPRALYIAGSDGTILLYEYTNAQLSILKQRLSDSDVYTNYEIVGGTNNTQGRLVTQNPTYNPTKRPWWNIILPNPPGAQNWSAIYPFANGALGISVVQKLGDSSALEDWKGALATDYALTDIDIYLLGRKPTERSHLVLYERTGQVVSTSYKSKLRPPASGRFTYLDIPVPEFYAAGQFLNVVSKGFFGRFFEKDYESFETSFLGENWNLDTAVVRDPRGIEWVILLMVPESDVIGVVTIEAQKLGITAAVITGVVSVVSIFTAQLLLQPLQDLKTRLERQMADINKREKAFSKKE